MKLLDRYLLKTFLSFFVITCVSFIGLYLIVDFFQRFRMFLSNDATAWQMASYFLYSIPLIISLVLPAAILLASLLTYSSLSKFSEITAMKANGISLYRISLPALGVAAILSIFLFFFSFLKHILIRLKQMILKKIFIILPVLLLLNCLSFFI
mgnify:CR=1 FL=1